MSIKSVSGNLLFHINTSNTDLKKGDLIHSGKILNPLFKQFYQNDILLNGYHKNIHEYINYYWHFTRETIFEDIRKKYFPHLPSRKKCLFLCDEKNVDYWINAKITSENYNILLLKVFGEIFKADTLFIDQTIPNYSNYLPNLAYVEECAKDYWSGHIIFSNKVEYLFYGDAEIVDIKKY